MRMTRESRDSGVKEECAHVTAVAGRAFASQGGKGAKDAEDVSTLCRMSK